MFFLYIFDLSSKKFTLYICSADFLGSGKYTLCMSKDKRLECFMTDIKIKHG